MKIMCIMMPYIVNNGVRIEYETYGSGVPVVLVHSFFCSKDIMENTGFVEQLIDQYLVILVDLRGHGFSDKPKGSNHYKMNLFVSDILAILDYLGINKVHYYGYSLGAWIGMGMHSRHPERLLSLAVGGAQPFDEWWLTNCAYWLNEYLKYGKKAIKIPKNAFRNVIEKVSDDPEFSNKKELLLSNVNHINDEVFQSVIDMSRNLESLQLDEALENSKIPCLFYGGDSDTGSWVGYERLLRQLKPDIELTTLKGGHVDFIFDYRQILTNLIEFWNNT